MDRTIDLALVHNLRARVSIGREGWVKKKREKKKIKRRRGIQRERGPRERIAGGIHDKLLASEWPLVKQPSGTLLPSADSIPWDSACPFSEVL